MHFPHPVEIQARRRRIIFLCASLLVVIGLVVYLCRPDEPVYENRSLSSWLQDYSNPWRNLRSARSLRSVNLSDPSENSRQAILAIGTNGLPTLLKYLQAQDSAAKKTLLAILQYTPLSHIVWTAQEKHEAAHVGFMILEKDASPAVPTLTRLTGDQDPDLRFRALEALIYVCQSNLKELAPVLISFCHDSSLANRRRASEEMQLVIPLLSTEETQKIGVYEAFPELRPSITEVAKQK